jgi:putative transposase
MGEVKRHHDVDFKTDVVLKVLKGQKTIAQISSETGLHPSLISVWKKAFIEGGKLNLHSRQDKSNQINIDFYEQKIAQLTYELNFIKKNCVLSNSDRILLVDKNCSELYSQREQGSILTNPLSSYYSKLSPQSEENLYIMRLIDKEFTVHPFYGKRKISAFLNNHPDITFPINIKRVSRLMHLMGLEAIYQKPKLSIHDRASFKYPYLLRKLNIDHPNHVWASDITYIPLTTGYLYLVAVIDWYSRFVLSWKLSNTLDSAFCIDALKEALLRYNKPEIFNTDQGSQFTCNEYVNLLLQNDIKVSFDGRGRATDNIMVERLWRSLKYEDVYIKDYSSVDDAYNNISNYLQFFNYERFHQSFKYRIPYQLYCENND